MVPECCTQSTHIVERKAAARSWRLPRSRHKTPYRQIDQPGSPVGIFQEIYQSLSRGLFEVNDLT